MLCIHRISWFIARVGTIPYSGCRRWFSALEYSTSVTPSREQKGTHAAEHQNASTDGTKYIAPIVKKQPNVPYYGAGITRQPVPLSASTVSWDTPDQPEDARVVKVALVGLPNAGKSSLMNALLKSPIAAVSPKVNTTREYIKGILCVENCQMIFTDCPGILESHRRRKFCSQLVSTAWRAYDEADVCLFVLDVVKRPDAALFRVIRSLAGTPPLMPANDSCYDHTASTDIDMRNQEGLQLNDQEVSDQDFEEEYMDDDDDECDSEAYIHGQKDTRKPVALVLNKIDLVEHKKWVKSRTREMKNHGTFTDIFYTSAKHGIGFAPILEFLKIMAKPGMWVYPPDMLTTMSRVQVVEQMVRTYIYCWFNKELPYRVGQKVIGWTAAENGSLIIEMELYVRNDKAAKIICGIQGRVLKQLQKNVSHRLSKMWNEPVFLYVQVKVKTGF